MTIRKLSFEGNSLENLKQSLAVEAHGITPQEAWSKGICIECKKPALEKCHTADGRGEYRISAMCEECFDALFAEEE